MGSEGTGPWRTTHTVFLWYVYLINLLIRGNLKVELRLHLWTCAMPSDSALSTAFWLSLALSIHRATMVPGPVSSFVPSSTALLSNRTATLSTGANCIYWFPSTKAASMDSVNKTESYHWTCSRTVGVSVFHYDRCLCLVSL